MQKFGTGRILDENGDENIRVTASAPMSEEDVRKIENEDEQEG